MKCRNCGYDLVSGVKYCTHCGSQVEAEYDKKLVDSSKYNSYSIASLVLALIPVLLFAFCYIYSGGDTSEAGNGAIFWLLIIYFWTIGFPIAIISIILGITSFKHKKGIVSILGIIIGSLPIALLAISFISAYIRLI